MCRATRSRVVADAGLDVAVELREDVVGQRVVEVVGDLARRGEVRARDFQKLARTLVERLERNRAELTRLVQKEINRQVKALGLATRDEVDALVAGIRKVQQVFG